MTAKDDKKEEARQEQESVVHSNSPKNIEQEVTIVSDEFGLAMYGQEVGPPSTTRTVSQKKKRPAARGDIVADDRAPRGK
jgi:hypothetical protein